MKFLLSTVTSAVHTGSDRRNMRILLSFFALLLTLISIFSILFHFIMQWEGRNFSWITGIYWTLTVMSTLGFGDITFTSDLGRIFSLIVLLSGIVLLLVMLPFTFIEFFYAPWMKSQLAARTPRELPSETHGHVVLTHLDVVTSSLITKFQQHNQPYVLLVPDNTEALRLYDQGYNVVVGALDDPHTYQQIRIHQAVLLATTAKDMVNTNVTFTVREMSETLPIVATADHPDSVDILELAGCTNVLLLSEMMGQALARRANAGKVVAHVIGQFEELLIAEASPRNTTLVGLTLRDSKLRENVGISIVGIWERGKFRTTHADTVIHENTILVLAGSKAQLDKYNALYSTNPHIKEPVLIIGGGRVGQATARTLSNQGVDYRIVEELPDIDQSVDPRKCVKGNAADFKILERAGIHLTPTAIITTGDDDTNIYLTIYCRRLRPNIQIISRATLEKNISTLHRAGADLVMSYASMGANTIFNLLKRSSIMMVAEGLDVLQMQIPQALIGKTIAESAIRQKTGCSVIALRTNGTMQINPDPNVPLPDQADIVLIGCVEAETAFLERYGTS